MKKIFFVGSLAIVLLTLGSCTTQGYVSSEPTYVEFARPERPSNLYIWIDGDWVYNRRSQVYVRQNGHWQRPSRNRTYVTNSWQSTPQDFAGNQAIGEDNIVRFSDRFIYKTRSNLLERVFQKQ